MTADVTGISLPVKQYNLFWSKDTRIQRRGPEAGPSVCWTHVLSRDRRLWSLTPGGKKGKIGVKLKLCSKLVQNCYLWQEPRHTGEFPLHLKDCALQPTVCERVLVIEGQASLVKEITITVYGIDLLDVFCWDNCGSEVDEVLMT